MTTKVTVDAHAGWSVSVEAFDPTMEYESEDTVIVKPGTVEVFYVHSTKALMITELSDGEDAQLE